MQKQQRLDLRNYRCKSKKKTNDRPRQNMDFRLWKLKERSTTSHPPSVLALVTLSRTGIIADPLSAFSDQAFESNTNQPSNQLNHTTRKNDDQAKHEYICRP